MAIDHPGEVVEGLEPLPFERRAPVVEEAPGEAMKVARVLWHRLLGGQCLSLADYVTVTAPTGEAVAAGCC